MTTPPPLAISSRARPVRAFGVDEGSGMSGTTLSSDGLDLRRRKLLFRSWHRGTKEMDLVMGRFMDSVLAGLDETELAEVEAWIELPDPQLYAWLIGHEAVPPQYDTALFRRWVAFHGG
jgi:antitoxin CptB